MAAVVVVVVVVVVVAVDVVSHNLEVEDDPKIDGVVGWGDG